MIRCILLICLSIFSYDVYGWTVDSLPPQLYVTGDTLCFTPYEEAIRVKDFREIRSCQFQIRWDAQAIQLDSVWPAADFSDGILVNATERQNGKLNAVWFNTVLLQGLTLPDETPLLYLRYQPANTGNQQSLVTFDTADLSFPFVFSQIINDTTRMVEAVGVEDWVNFSAPDIVDTTLIAATSGLANGSIQIAIEGGKPPYSVAWDNGMMGLEITGLAAGRYVCSIVDANGCTRQFGPFRIDETSAVASIPSEDTVLLFPNPFTHQLNVQSDLKWQSLTLYDQLGRLLFSHHKTFTNLQLELGLLHLPTGIYCVKLVSPSGKTICKQIVK